MSRSKSQGKSRTSGSPVRKGGAAAAASKSGKSKGKRPANRVAASDAERKAVPLDLTSPGVRSKAAQYLGEIQRGQLRAVEALLASRQLTAEDYAVRINARA